MRCLLLGGGGPVGVALMYQLRQLGYTVAVVDPVRPKHFDIHKKAWGTALESWTERRFDVKDLKARLSASPFDVVVELTPTLDKRLSIAICDELDVPLVNSTMVDYKDDIHIAAYNFLDSRPTAKRRPHVVASGMNPGAVNAMAEEIIAQHGQPDSIVYWEYDNSEPADGKFPGPCTTWCVGESHAEITEDWNFEVIEEGTVLLHEDALSWTRHSFRDCGIPLDTLPIPADADAFLIGHEECVYMGWRHDTAVKFVYGFHPDNMRQIRAAGYDGQPTLLVHAPGKPVIGRDIVGVSCRYDDEHCWRGQYVMMENSAQVPPDTNVTCQLVAAGVMASVLLLRDAPPRPGVHLTHELPGWMSAFRRLVTTHECVVTDGEQERPAIMSASPSEAMR